MKNRFPQIVCKDGTRLSVQAGQYHYSEPRTYKGPYTEVEVGFPSIKPPDTWEQYCEDWDKPTDTVYAYVPIALVEDFIASHGGIDLSQTL